MLGKLKRTIKERCPECKSLLQIREISNRELRKGEIIYVPKEYIACSNKNCGYTRAKEQKRVRRQEEYA